jgi:hypothetical protein
MTDSNTGNAMIALSANWLDSAQNCTDQLTGGNLQSMTLTTTGYCQPYTNFPYYYNGYSYPVYIASPARPIKLTLSEVERLRKFAKADEKVKAILMKFTDLIEVTVDFE